MQANTI